MAGAKRLRAQRKVSFPASTMKEGRAVNENPRKTAIIPDLPDIPSLIYIVAYFFPFS